MVLLWEALTTNGSRLVVFALRVGGVMCYICGGILSLIFPPHGICCNLSIHSNASFVRDMVGGKIGVYFNSWIARIPRLSSRIGVII